MKDLAVVRHGGAGVGYDTNPSHFPGVLPVSSSSGSSAAAQDLSQGGDSDVIMVYSWNAGNLDRRSKMDRLTQTFVGAYHIGLFPEASEGIIAQHLQASAFAHVSSRNSCCSIAAGGSAKKRIEWMSVNIPRTNAETEPFTSINCMFGRISWQLLRQSNEAPVAKQPKLLANFTASLPEAERARATQIMNPESGYEGGRLVSRAGLTQVNVRL